VAARSATRRRRAGRAGVSRTLCPGARRAGAGVATGSATEGRKCGSSAGGAGADRNRSASRLNAERRGGGGAGGEAAAGGGSGSSPTSASVSCSARRTVGTTRAPTGARAAARRSSTGAFRRSPGPFSCSAGALRRSPGPFSCSAGAFSCSAGASGCEGRDAGGGVGERRKDWRSMTGSRSLRSRTGSRGLRWRTGSCGPPSTIGPRAGPRSITGSLRLPTTSPRGGPSTTRLWGSGCADRSPSGSAARAPERDARNGGGCPAFSAGTAAPPTNGIPLTSPSPNSHCAAKSLMPGSRGTSSATDSVSRADGCAGATRECAGPGTGISRGWVGCAAGHCRPRTDSASLAAGRCLAKAARACSRPASTVWRCHVFCSGIALPAGFEESPTVGVLEVEQGIERPVVVLAERGHLRKQAVRRWPRHSPRRPSSISVKSTSNWWPQLGQDRIPTASPSLFRRSYSRCR